MGKTWVSTRLNPISPLIALIVVLDGELENYFNVLLTHLPIEGAFPIHHHLVIIEEELQKPFLSDLATLAKLERSLLKVVESIDAETLASLRQVCIDITLSLSEAILDHQMYKARHDSSMKDWEELAPLKT